VDGAFVIIAWVAVKLVVEFLHTQGYVALSIPTWLSIVLIFVIFGISFLYAVSEERRRKPSPVSKEERQARRLFIEEEEGR
jgi:predicted tellurium resistance membrane protein TerC